MGENGKRIPLFYFSYKSVFPTEADCTFPTPLDLLALKQQGEHVGVLRIYHIFGTI